MQAHFKKCPLNALLPNLNITSVSETINVTKCPQNLGGGGGGVLPYMDYKGMCRCEGYGFQAVYSRIEYINHSLSV